MDGQLKLEPYDIHELMRKHKRKRKSNKCIHQRDCVGVIEEFLESDYDCCKVFTGVDGRKAHIEGTILRRSVKIIGANVRVIQRGNDVFLVRKDLWDEQVKKEAIKYEN